ncbi:hypothetical protein IKE72_01685 [Candidatus Saccharibacteria bacterium]|nr:hypothetical protein [Candidatus Saccharibacteria bacterium]
MYIEDNLEWIWQTYKNVRAGDLIIRSGFGLTGVYEYDQKAGLSFRHHESDTEHAAGCIEIARNLSRAFPDLFSGSEWLRIFDLLKYHDLGEVAYGDRPDDGTQNAAEKDAIELIAFRSAITYLPSDDAGTLLWDFWTFQRVDSFSQNNSSHFRLACFARLCDKLDAVLRAIIYELNGVSGDLKYKEEHFSALSERDQYYIQQTGTTKIAPNWTLHFIDICHRYPYFALFFRILENAVRDVNNGEFYGWLPEVKERFEVTEQEMHYCELL